LFELAKFQISTTLVTDPLIAQEHNKMKAPALLKRSLKKHSANQTDVADQLGVAVSTVSRWYSGQQRISIEKAIQLEDAFGINAEKLLIAQVRDDLAEARS